MNFDNSLAYVMYKFYNQFGIHNAPEEVLDFLAENFLVVRH